MRDDWRTVDSAMSAELRSIDKVRLDPTGVPRSRACSTNGKGLLQLETWSPGGLQLAPPTLHRLHAGQLVDAQADCMGGRRLRRCRRATTASFVSPEFPTFDTRSGRAHSRVHDAALSAVRHSGPRCGSRNWHVQRRKRLSPAELMGIRLDLPPLVEQRRIVDLVACGRRSAVHVVNARVRRRRTAYRPRCSILDGFDGIRPAGWRSRRWARGPSWKARPITASAQLRRRGGRLMITQHTAAIGRLELGAETYGSRLCPEGDAPR